MVDKKKKTETKKEAAYKAFYTRTGEAYINKDWITAIVRGAMGTDIHMVSGTIFTVEPGVASFSEVCDELGWMT